MLTFNAKGGSLGRLSNTGEHVELHVGAHGLNQADCGGALTFTQRSGRNTADRMTAQVQKCNKKRKKVPNSTEIVLLALFKLTADGTYPVTTTYLPSGWDCSRFMMLSCTLAFVLPYSSTSSESKPTSLARLSIGLGTVEREIAMSLLEVTRKIK